MTSSVEPDWPVLEGASTPIQLNEHEHATRHNEGKPKFSILDEMPSALEGVVRVLEDGAKVYGRRNYQKGLPLSEVYDSMRRHQLAWLNGEDLDKKSGLPHVDHILANALFLAELTRRTPHMDDRCA